MHIKINKKIKTLFLGNPLVYNRFMEIKNKTIILASASPRRLAILRDHGIEPVVHPADIEEIIPEYEDVHEVPSFIASSKATSVLRECESTDGIIIAADTIVYLGDPKGQGEIMGKPTDPEDGFRMLSMLRDRTHLVITGVCLIDIATGTRRVFTETTYVTFTPIPDDELVSYLETPEAYDKAGGYAIQGTFSKYIKSFDGSYDNVVGFPWERVYKEINILQEELSK